MDRAIQTAPFQRITMAIALLVATLGLLPGTGRADRHTPKPATELTQQANMALYESLPFSNRQDFDFATRGLIAGPESLVIKDAHGQIVWDLAAFGFVSDEARAPDTVNPSLWRNAQLLNHTGLYKVMDRVYQVRGFDLSNITFIQGDTGWVVFDPLISSETARAALDLVTKHLGKRPVRAVVYSHSHVDHYGGVRGVVDEVEVTEGRVKIIAPHEFMHHAIKENVTAGNAMSRRAIYMYGALLPKGPKSGVSSGLGLGTSTGATGVIAPTHHITTTGQEMTVDGVKMVFQMTPGGEAPAEMNTYFPQFKGLWMAENCTATLHNLYTLRGAQVRDGKKWAGFIDEAIGLYGHDAEVVFQSHHWPRWGNAVLVDYMKKQRDLYKYIHDQTVRLINHGYTSTEIAEMMELPPEVGMAWFNRGYYGSVKHNTKAVYQGYMGWYDANPAHLDPLPTEPAAKKYLAYMGGAAKVLELARKDFDRGEYRWVAQVTSQVVFADPGNRVARELCADALEQLGYQAESGAWRGAYLQGAFELRNGVPASGGLNTVSPDTIRAMTPEMLFDYLAIRLNGPRAAGMKMIFNIHFTDLEEPYLLTLENGVLNHWPGQVAPKADATVSLTKPTLNAIQLGQTTMAKAMASGSLTITGEQKRFEAFLGLLDTFPFWFNIVTP